MPTQDISRFLHQPEKHYAGVRMQQGRVILDSDWNERSSIEAEDLRRTISELACSKGTPNAGMSVSNVAEVAPYDFDIANGSFYLGGMRLVVDAADPGETYRTQTDWLQNDAVDGSAITVPEGDRIDLIYVYAWEQPVSAVEDSELFEVALGGRDTSVRMRRMRRFQSYVTSSTDAGFSATDAFEEFVSTLSSGTFDFTTSELRSNGKLLVGTDSGNQSSEDPCNIPEVVGYVGAENQAIRVELRASNKLTWGFDNASPLYRVQVGAAPYTTLTFLTEPADLPSMPREDQIVEIIRWGAKLSNTEKVAELQGTLHKVATTYDPTTRQLVLTTAVDEDWIEWLSDHEVHYNVDDEEAEQQYFYLRVWDRGRDTTSLPELSYTLDEAQALGHTGLEITVTAHGMAGDHWIIAARPSTPNKFVPWDLGNAAVRPHGPRRFYAPLALIRWDAGEATVEDARTRLRPMCEGGCCKVSVGNGYESHGQVDTLEDAIALIADTGGKICVLPGTHETTAELDDLHDIVIEGCGARSILKNPEAEVRSTDPGSIYPSVLKIFRCTNITVKDLRIEANHAYGVCVEQLLEADTCSQIRLEHLDIHCLGIIGGDVVPGEYIYEQPRSGIAVLGASEVDILDCQVSMVNVTTNSYAVMLAGTHLRMHRCTLLADAVEGFVSKAAGGLSIRSLSRDIEVVGCRIEGGRFSGIDLGHRMLAPRSAEEALPPPGIFETYTLLPNDSHGSYTVNGACIDAGDPNEESEPDDPEFIYIPAGPVEDIRIHDNVIRGMGCSGISTSVFFNANNDWDNNGEADGVPRFIVAAELDIARNLIEGNARHGFNQNLHNFYRASGGIALSACINAWIHENTVRNNGTGYTIPTCGIGIVAAQNVVIEDNRIIDNGERHPNAATPWVSRGLRGGIVIWEATTVRHTEGQPTFPVEIPSQEVRGTNKDYTTASHESAVIVRGNEVSQPLGKALWIRRGFGPITVTGNSFESFGDPVNDVQIGTTQLCWQPDVGTALAIPARGTVVEIIDYARAIEVDWSSVEDEVEELSWTDVAGGTVDGGGILFSNNSVKSTWAAHAVQPSAVFICSFDHASVCGNSVRTELAPATGVGSVAAFYDSAAGRAGTGGFYVAAVYVAATSTASAVANRVVHEKYGALFSILVGPPAVLDGDFHREIVNGAMLTSNVGTHAIVGDEPSPGPLVNEDNITIFPDASATYTVSVPVDTRNILVTGT